MFGPLASMAVACVAARTMDFASRPTSLEEFDTIHWARLNGYVVMRRGSKLHLSRAR